MDNLKYNEKTGEFDIVENVNSTKYGYKKTASQGYGKTQHCKNNKGNFTTQAILLLFTCIFTACGILFFIFGINQEWKGNIIGFMFLSGVFFFIALCLFVSFLGVLFES